MYKSLISIFSLLSKSQKANFYRLQFLVVLMAIFELVSVASVAPFMTMIADPSIFENSQLINEVADYYMIDDKHSVTFILGFIVLTLLLLSTFISIFTTWRLSVFSSKIGVEIANRLYRYYMFQSWVFHSNGSSSEHIKNISAESIRLTQMVIVPLMNINAKLVLSFFLAVGLIVVNPVVALVGLVLFGSSYILMFIFVRARLNRNGSLITNILSERFSLMSEGFGGIKDLMVLGRQQQYVDRFERSGSVLVRSEGMNQALSMVPRYFIEFAAFSSVIMFALFLIAYYESDAKDILPILAIYCLAALKLLPAFQYIYAGLASIKAGLPSFFRIEKDLADSRQFENTSRLSRSGYKLPIVHIKKSVVLDNITFSYRKDVKPTLRCLSVEINKGEFIGIVGKSGSGKSTLIDILIGLYKPDNGNVLIDGVPLTETDYEQWRSSIGYVPQSIYLSEGSILENIAFGIPADQIDIARAIEAARQALLGDFLESQPQGIHSRVGERGVKLSGGQRQRIGIARALYNDPDIMIFDEATSALDGISERLVLDSIINIAKTKTLIMVAHRLTTLKACSCIYVIEEGSIKDSGTYVDLSSKSGLFKDMSGDVDKISE